MNRPYRDYGREPRIRINERIRAPEIRVIDENNQQLGIMSSRQAYQLARERGLDLVEVAATAQPPVCRIIDYGKYKYEQEKKERDNKKKSHQMDVKGIQLRPGTDDHDIEFKIKNAIRFLSEGDKVKVTVRFRSREITHPEIARRSLQRIVDETASVGVVERPPLMEGKQMIMILTPKQQPGQEKTDKVEKADKTDTPETPQDQKSEEQPQQAQEAQQAKPKAQKPETPKPETPKPEAQKGASDNAETENQKDGGETV